MVFGSSGNCLGALKPFPVVFGYVKRRGIYKGYLIGGKRILFRWHKPCITGCVQIKYVIYFKASCKGIMCQLPRRIVGTYVQFFVRTSLIERLSFQTVCETRHRYPIVIVQDAP